MTSHVLIPSDETSFPQNFINGYRRIGFEPVLGRANLRQGTAKASVTHLLWPEEFYDWACPRPGQTAEMQEILLRRREKSIIIQSVNNLYPHGGSGNPDWHEAYSAFYRCADVIHHFSESSKEAVLLEFPEFSKSSHVVTNGIDYSRISQYRNLARDEARSRLGIQPKDRVFLVFGAIRFKSEFELLIRSWRRASQAGAVLLFAGRLSLQGEDRMKAVLMRKWMKWKLRRLGAIILDRFIAESELPEIFDASDAVIVLRNESLSSGIPCLGMCLGRFVIAPRIGSILDYMGEENRGLYEVGDHEDLSEVILKSMSLDLEDAAAENFVRSCAWDWERGAAKILAAIPPDRRMLLT
jgi:glycosyltransferase involved in cell wall biosynthesis